MVYAPEFFSLQLRFAHTLARLRGIPLAQALLECTNFYVRFGCGSGFDAAHPVWQGYLEQVLDARDQVAATHAFHLARASAVAGPAVNHTCGCFSWEDFGGNRVRLHFQNVDTQPPFSAQRLGLRRDELAALFAHLRSNTSGDPLVTGTSWLYNLPAYRSLFPASYVASAMPVQGAWQRLPLWGQFLDRDRGVRAAPAALFLQRLEQLASADTADACFPLQAIAVQAPAREFYRHFRL